MQEASGLRRTPRRISSYLLQLCWGVQLVDIHHHMSRGIGRSTVLYIQAALSRSALKLPLSVLEVIKQMFPDHANIVGQAWKRIWWIACSVCVTTLWPQRSQSIHKRQSTSTEQEVAEVKQVLVRQLRAVAMKEQRRDMDVSNDVYLHLATELFQDNIDTRQSIRHSSRSRQETYPVST